LFLKFDIIFNVVVILLRFCTIWLSLVNVFMMARGKLSSEDKCTFKVLTIRVQGVKNLS